MQEPRGRGEPIQPIFSNLTCLCLCAGSLTWCLGPSPRPAVVQDRQQRDEDAKGGRSSSGRGTSSLRPGHVFVLCFLLVPVRTLACSSEASNNASPLPKKQTKHRVDWQTQMTSIWAGLHFFSPSVTVPTNSSTLGPDIVRASAGRLRCDLSEGLLLHSFFLLGGGCASVSRFARGLQAAPSVLHLSPPDSQCDSL